MQSMSALPCTTTHWPMMYVNDLNLFYARFDENKFHSEFNEMFNVVKSKHDQKICISREDVSLALNSAKPGKACISDKICAKL